MAGRSDAHSHTAASVPDFGPLEVVVNDVTYVREATLLACMERHDALKMALAEACDVAIWMSGADAFGPQGEAAEGWPAQRDRLHKALAVLHG